MDFLEGIDTVWLLGAIAFITPVVTDYLIKWFKLQTDKAKTVAPVLVSGAAALALVVYRQPDVQLIIAPYVAYAGTIFTLAHLIYKLGYKKSDIRSTITPVSKEEIREIKVKDLQEEMDKIQEDRTNELQDETLTSEPEEVVEMIDIEDPASDPGVPHA